MVVSKLILNNGYLFVQDIWIVDGILGRNLVNTLQYANAPLLLDCVLTIEQRA